LTPSLLFGKGGMLAGCCLICGSTQQSAEQKHGHGSHDPARDVDVTAAVLDFEYGEQGESGRGARQSASFTQGDRQEGNGQDIEHGNGLARSVVEPTQDGNGYEKPDRDPDGFARIEAIPGHRPRAVRILRVGHQGIHLRSIVTVP
jgi:hypothetical protein